MRNRRPALSAILPLLVLIAGCFGGRYEPIGHFALEPTLTITPGTPGDDSIGVQPLDYARMYKLRMVFRGQGHELGYRANAQWAELPRDTVTRTLIDALRASKLFADAGPAFEIARPILLLTGEVRIFDEDRETEPWQARCEVRLDLRKREDDSLVWSETFRAAEPMAGTSPEDFAAAMSTAIAALAQHVVERVTP